MMGFQLHPMNRDSIIGAFIWSLIFQQLPNQAHSNLEKQMKQT